MVLGNAVQSKSCFVGSRFLQLFLWICCPYLAFAENSPHVAVGLFQCEVVLAMGSRIG